MSRKGLWRRWVRLADSCGGCLVIVIVKAAGIAAVAYVVVKCNA